jgi:hypothetical protein
LANPPGSGRRPIDRAGEISGQIGLTQRDGVAVENLAFDAVAPGSLEIADRVCKGCIGAKQLDPPGPPQQFRHFSLGNERLVLDQAALDQGQFGHRAVQSPVRRRCKEVARQPRQNGRQVGELIAHLRRAIQRVLQDLSEIPGKHIRKNRRTFDQSGVPETGLFAGEFVPVDQDHVPPPPLQVQGGADADHACAQYENIGPEFRHPPLR